ncbi:polysaccharide deacetylase family protein [Tateyamaria sp. SN3-11]|uniref:polysaccharide deacetylase family protein n=1 Tax=Tateyamaria sp. SN3-11 TaxID=3092147 RepID=UPI0039E9E577
MSGDWTPLRNALTECRRDGMAVPLWWRDDDAIAPTQALDQLRGLSEEIDLSVHLAVIPSLAQPALVDAMAGMIPVVHGWAHQDHSTAPEKKNEFQTPRPDAVEETAMALARMHDIFGTRLRPMFVPPWNRINADVTQALAAQGYTALSTFGPRAGPQAAPGLTQINTHIDPIWWKGTRDLVDPDHLIAQTVRHLTARRTGTEDTEEPLGLLTHHLVHTPEIWSFTRAFLHEMISGGATSWVMESKT